MNNKLIEILVRAKDDASRTLANVTGSLDNTTAAGARQTTAMQKLRENWVAVAGIMASSGVAFRGLTNFIGDNVEAAVRLQSALTGLSSVARAFGADAGKAEAAARSLARDGLMTVSDAATGLKNLLAAGFNLDEATQLMTRFKDSAAFGRQSALGFGQAIASATEGIKNGNSILVDNAGVTKNLSMMLTDAGFSAQDLMRASSDAGVRMAIFNGILKETTPQLGDAARLSESFAGAQARNAAQAEVLRAQIGESLQPVLTRLLETVTPLIVRFAEFTDKHPTLVSNTILAVTAVVGLTFAFGALGLAITGLGPVFAIFGATATATFTGVGMGFRAMSLLIATPLIMPAIAVAAALAAIAQVHSAYQNLRAEQGRTEAAIDSLNRSMEQSIAKGKLTLDQAYKIQNSAGYTGNKTVYKSGNTYLPGYSVGGYTGRGNSNEVAGVVHKGEYVLPQSEVDQSTGKPKGNGVTVNQTNHIYNDTDWTTAAYEMGWRLANA